MERAYAAIACDDCPSYYSVFVGADGVVVGAGGTVASSLLAL